MSSTSTSPAHHSIVDLLSKPFEILLPDSSLTEKVWTSDIAFGDPDETELATVQSILPCAVNCVLEILSSSDLRNSSLRGLQSLFIPAISNYHQKLVATADRKEWLPRLHNEAKRLKEKLSIQLTLEGIDRRLWGFVPQVQKNPSPPQRWNHVEHPTICFTPLLDLLFRKCKSSEERAHVLAFALVVIMRELAHLLPRSIYGEASEDMPEAVKSPWDSRAEMGKGEGGEGVERYITGGNDFNIANDLSLDSFDSAAPSHGWRVVGEVEEDNHRSQVVVADDRIIDFLRFFLWDLYNLASLGPVSRPAPSPTSDTSNLLPLAESLVPGSPISLSPAPVLKNWSTMFGTGNDKDIAFGVREDIVPLRLLKRSVKTHVSVAD